MKISSDMVFLLNQTLESLNCCFRLEFVSDGKDKSNPKCKVVPSNDKFIHSSIINLTTEFYILLEEFFAKRGIELHYNNDRSTFWSKDGWKDEE